MSLDAASIPIAPRPAPTVLLVASAGDPTATQQLRTIGYASQLVDNPYAALLALLRKPLAYRAIVLSLQALYREELSLIRTLRSKLSHVDVWLIHTAGREASLAEAIALGATGLVSELGLHRLGGEDTSPAMNESQDMRVGSIESIALQPSSMQIVSISSLPAASTDRAESESHSSASSARIHHDDEPHDADPILTAEELRALLQSEPASE